MNNGMGMTVREDFGGRSISHTGETQQTALAAQATAAVQARYVMAERRPRSWDNVRARLLEECKRPSFAKAARYNKPVGKGLQGLSIRFAEACMRYAGNLSCEAMVVYEDATRRIAVVTCTDYETNASFAANISLDKTIERSDPKDRSILGERMNSAGQKTYLLEATEDELLNKMNALVSKAARTLILRMIPGDLKEEAERACIDTLKREVTSDPAAHRKACCDNFARIGVMPDALERYLGHPLESMSPDELVELRAVFATIQDGEGSWADILEAKRGTAATTTAPGAEGKPAASPTAAVADKVKAKAEELKAKRDAKRAAKAGGAAAPAPATAVATPPPAPSPGPAAAPEPASAPPVAAEPEPEPDETEPPLDEPPADLRLAADDEPNGNAER